MGKISGGCLLESVSVIWYSFLLEDKRANLSLQSCHLAVCTSFETLCFACLYKCLKIVSLGFLHYLSTFHLSHFASKSSALIDSMHGEEW